MNNDSVENTKVAARGSRNQDAIGELLQVFWGRYGYRKQRLAAVLTRFAKRHSIYRSIAPPAHCYIELNTYCNLKCPLCPSGSGNIDRIPKAMEWDIFRLIVDDLAKFRVNSTLNMWGEPLLNPEFIPMTRYAHEKGLRSLSCNTNGNIDKDEAWFRELVQSGLSSILIDIDGADAETYGKYRKRGRFELVLDFFRKLGEAKKSLHSDLPHVIALTVVNRYNQDQLDDIRSLIESFGVTELRTRNIGHIGMIPIKAGMFAEFMQTKYPEQNPQAIDKEGMVCFYPSVSPPQQLICEYLWDGLAIDECGNYVPCCKEYSTTSVLGNVREISPTEFWFSRTMAEFRKRNLLDPLSIPLCAKCYFVCHIRGFVSEPVRRFGPASGPETDRRTENPSC
ncbi:radical SAM protein [Candidatus Poribacteria bacterium]|nr:radical SAM protein [Candidatus Poribacteria bacterium]